MSVKIDVLAVCRFAIIIIVKCAVLVGAVRTSMAWVGHSAVSCLCVCAESDLVQLLVWPTCQRCLRGCASAWRLDPDVGSREWPSVPWRGRASYQPNPPPCPLLHSNVIIGQRQRLRCGWCNLQWGRNCLRQYSVIYRKLPTVYLMLYNAKMRDTHQPTPMHYLNKYNR